MHTWTWNDAVQAYRQEMQAAAWLDFRRANLYRADLTGADLSRANLTGANLTWANLTWADLSGADLSRADLTGASYGPGIPITRKPLQIHGLWWSVIIMDHHIKIGCEIHSTEEWREFDDDEIEEMDDDALEFWRAYSTAILEVAYAHQGDDRI